MARAGNMQALICSEFCEPLDLTIGDLPSPDLPTDSVRVHVHAAALNFPDFLMVQGKYQYKPPFPFSPGMECAGEVIEVGSEVQNFKAGDRVACHPWFGCVAEEVVAPASLTYPIPDEMNYEIAAGFCLTHGTVYHALLDRGRLQAGETVLVLGAAGGVGLNACTLAKALGATVIAAASNDEKLALTRSHGADITVNYTTESLRDRVKEATGGKGADLIFDPVGGDMTDQAMRSISWSGRLLIIGFAAGRIAAIPSNHILIKGVEVIGVATQRFSRLEPEKAHDDMRALFELWKEGALKPYNGSVYPFTEAAQAIDDMAKRKAIGKSIITIR
jgi:NADPH:quinone reductase